MEVLINNIEIKVILKIKKIKHIYFRFDEETNLIITSRLKLKDKDISALIAKNMSSLASLLNKTQLITTNEKVFSFLGKSYILVWDESKKQVEVEDEFFFAPNKKELTKFIKKECFRLFTERINFYQSQMSFVVSTSLRIRTMKTRWGVCNRSKKIITLNEKLIRFELKVIDYVIIHELCHYKEANHQKNFWKLVSFYDPEYKKHRAKLKEM